jgi:hypothetical protein
MVDVRNRLAEDKHAVSSQLGHGGKSGVRSPNSAPTAIYVVPVTEYFTRKFVDLIFAGNPEAGFRNSRRSGYLIASAAIRSVTNASITSRALMSP